MKGKEEFSTCRPHGIRGLAALKGPFREVIMTWVNFKVKGHFTPKLGGMCWRYFWTRVKRNIRRKENCWFEEQRWIWQEGSTDGSLPIGSSVDRWGDKIDQILMGSSLGGNILFRKYFCFAPSMYLSWSARTRLVQGTVMCPWSL